MTVILVARALKVGGGSQNQSHRVAWLVRLRRQRIGDVWLGFLSIGVKELNRSSTEAVFFSSVHLLANHAPSLSLCLYWGMPIGALYRVQDAIREL